MNNLDANTVMDLICETYEMTPEILDELTIEDFFKFVRQHKDIYAVDDFTAFRLEKLAMQYCS